MARRTQRVCCCQHYLFCLRCWMYCKSFGPFRHIGVPAGKTLPTCRAWALGFFLERGHRTPSQSITLYRLTSDALIHSLTLYSLQPLSLSLFLSHSLSLSFSHSLSISISLTHSLSFSHSLSLSLPLPGASRIILRND